jgi:hypothetical protein
MPGTSGTKTFCTSREAATAACCVLRDSIDRLLYQKSAARRPAKWLGTVAYLRALSY